MVSVLNSYTVHVSKAADMIHSRTDLVRRYSLYIKEPRNKLVKRFRKYQDAFLYVNSVDWHCDVCIIYEFRDSYGIFRPYIREYFPFDGFLQTSLDLFPSSYITPKN